MNTDIHFLKEILSQKGKLFPEIQSLLSLNIEELEKKKAYYSRSDKSITYSTKLLREPIAGQEAVIMHELCHHAVFCLYGSALLPIFAEIAAAKLHFEKDATSFKVLTQTGGFLSSEEYFLQWFSGHDIEKTRLDILGAIGVLLRVNILENVSSKELSSLPFSLIRLTQRNSLRDFLKSYFRNHQMMKDMNCGK